MYRLIIAFIAAAFVIAAISLLSSGAFSSTELPQRAADTTIVLGQITASTPEPLPTFPAAGLLTFLAAVGLTLLQGGPRRR